MKKLIRICMAILFCISICGTGMAQNQQSAPPQKCLNFDKSIFKVGNDIASITAFNLQPQYCVIYSLMGSIVMQKTNDGYIIARNANGDGQIHLESDKNYQSTQQLLAFEPGFHGDTSFNELLDINIAKPSGAWAYYAGTEKATMENGFEKEIYIFKEQDF